MGRQRRVLLVVCVVALTIIALGTVVWWLGRTSFPSDKPLLTGRVESVGLTPDGRTMFWTQAADGRWWRVGLMPSAYVRYRDGSAGSVQAGQTVTVWAGSIANTVLRPTGDPRDKEAFEACAEAVGIEADGP